MTLFLMLIQFVLPAILHEKSKKLVDTCFSYLSPFIVIQSIALLVYFIRMDISNNIVRRTVSIISPLTFSVYLLHVKTPIYDRIFPWILKPSLHNPLLFLPVVLLGGIAVFLLCACIDYIREFLFRMLRINEAIDKLSTVIQNKVCRLVNKVIS